MKKLLFFFWLFFSFSFLMANESNSPAKEKEPDLFIYFTAGPNLSAPNGSFIRHEKLFDETQNLMIMSGQLKNGAPFENMPTIPKSAQYEAGGLFMMGFEQKLSKYLGLGSSLSVTNVWAKRLNLFRDPRDGNVYVFPYIRIKDDFVMALSALTADVYFHFFEFNKFKPFMSFRTGPVFASGNAHHGFTLAVDREDESIHNGRGIVYGSSLGSNIFFTPNFGLRPEIFYLRYDFQADEFSNRSYYNVFLNIGFFGYF